MNLKKTLFDTLTIIAITIVILVAIEIILRVVFPELKDFRKSPAALGYEYNKDYIISLKQNIEKEYKIKKEDGGGTVIWKTNSLGFRGEEIGNKNGLRVIVYGDSNIQARFSDYKDTYPAALQKLLRVNTPNAQVINAGIVGAGPDQSLLRLSADFNTVNPDIVIFQITADNDYGDIIRNRLYEISENGELIRTEFPITLDKKLKSIGPVIGNLFRYFYLQGAVNYIVSEAVSYKESTLSEEEKAVATLNLLEQKVSLGFNIYKEHKPRLLSHFEDYYDIDIAAHPKSESARIKIALMEKILLTANKFSSQKKVLFLIVVEPSSFDLILNIRNGGVGYQSLAKKYKNYKPTNFTAPLKEICTSHHLNCVHLIDSYQLNEPESLYRHDGHWNTKGQQLAAKETAKKIRVLQLLNSTHLK